MESHVFLRRYNTPEGRKNALVLRVTGLIEWEFTIYDFFGQYDDRDNWYELLTSDNYGGIGLYSTDKVNFTMSKSNGKLIIESESYVPQCSCNQRMVLPAALFDKKILHCMEILDGAAMD